MLSFSGIKHCMKLDVHLRGTIYEERVVSSYG